MSDRRLHNKKKDIRKIRLGKKKKSKKSKKPKKPVKKPFNFKEFEEKRKREKEERVRELEKADKNLIDVMSILKETPGNSYLTEGDRRKIRSGYVTVKNNMLYVPDEKTFLRQVNIPEERQWDSLRNIQAHNGSGGIVLTREQRNDLIVSLLFKGGSGSNTDRVASLMKGIVNEDIALAKLRLVYPDRDIMPIEKRKDVVDGILKRNNMKEEDREKVLRELKQWSPVDFIDKYNGLIEVKSTGNNFTFAREEFPKEFFSFNNYNKVVNTKFIEPESRRLDIVIIDKLKDLYEYRLRLDRVNQRDNFILKQKINQYNPVHKGGFEIDREGKFKLSADRDMINIYHTAIISDERALGISEENRIHLSSLDDSVGNPKPANKINIFIPYDRFSKLEPDVSDDEETKEDN